MKYTLLISVFVFFTTLVGAGELVTEAEIVRIGSSSNGVNDDFFITVSGGTGSCVNTNIVFYRSNAPSDAFFNRLYSTALLAYSTGSKRVRIHGITASCTSATYIDLRKN